MSAQHYQPSPFKRNLLLPLTVLDLQQKSNHNMSASSSQELYKKVTASKRISIGGGSNKQVQIGHYNSVKNGLGQGAYSTQKNLKGE